MSQSRNVLLYHNRDKQTIVTTVEGYEYVKAYLQALRARAGIATGTGTGPATGIATGTATMANAASAVAATTASKR